MSQGQFVLEIAAFHPELRMLGVVHSQKQIACGAAAHASAALSGNTQALALAHARGGMRTL